ncbi:right-handed parallel beta-helix repeat-containing protein, partial [Bartonella queenslandensis]|uniref:right-handed parallel beta-helix repeat-containing protein n=1 Tax=Bartonella queenslandensis TaxID=481138 RepID=UPI001BAD1B88
MYKKSLLSSMATAAIVLFNIQFNVHAKSLEVSGETKEIINDDTYETLHALKGGQITGTDLKVTGNKDTNIYVISAEGKGSAIKLTGDKTTIKGTDSDIHFGLEAKDDAVLQMTGGTITVSNTGVHFFNSHSTENKLENVTVTQATNAVFADNNSTITIIGGSFNAKDVTIAALKGSTITLNNAQITSGNVGLYSKDSQSTITMTGGNITGEFAALSAENGGHITVTNVTLATNGDGIDIKPDDPNANIKITNGFGAFSKGSNSVIELLGDTKISDSKIGLGVKEDGVIRMTGGTIKAAFAGAIFDNSKKEENKLENVTISSNKEDVLLLNGINANKSTVTLENVKVTQANNAVSADNNSTITISGGSFETKKIAVSAYNGSTITLNNSVQITSENSGLYAKDGGAISMTGGTIQTSEIGAKFENSKRKENKLENVTISSDKKDTLLKNGINANKSTVDLKNVKVTQVTHALLADNESTITVSGGSFDTKLATIASENDSMVTLTSIDQITSSEDTALFAQNGGAISMTEGSIKAAIAGAKFENSKRKENSLENVIISSVKDDALIMNGIAADKSTVALTNVTVKQAGNAISANNDSTITVSGGSFDAKLATIVSTDNSIVALTNINQITSSEDDGLLAKNGGAISMTGGAIKSFKAGAAFENSKRKENKLENVTISSGKDDALIKNGIAADKSTVALTNVIVKQAGNAISANNDSTITVSGGSFDAKLATIVSTDNSIVALTNINQITSSEDDGLLAKDGGAISMTGGNIKAFYNGAAFQNSKREENKLENVIISSVKDDARLNIGVSANKSTVALTNVKISQATNAIVADNHSTITISGGSFESESDGVYAKQGSSITLNNTTVISSHGEGIYASDSDSKIVMIGGSATTKSGNVALLTEHEGQIDATDVTLTTDGIGTGTLALGKKSKIELHGNTTIDNTLNGLRAVDGGKITSENLTITGGKRINSGLDTERSGLTTEGAESEINLTGKTIIQNVDEGLYADGGSKITSGDLTIIGGESENITVAVGSYESESKIELNGNTIIKNFDLALGAAGGASIKMKNGTKNQIDVKKVALSAIGGGKIGLANTLAKAGNIGVQLMALLKTNTDELDDLQTYGNNEVNLANTELHVDNGTGIVVGALAKKNIGDIPTLSIGTLNLKDSKIHADVLLDDDIFWDKISWQEENIWNDENIKKISTGSFTLNADHSTLEGRANIAQERNVRFDLKNGTQWILKNSTQEKDAEGNLLDIAQRSRSDISVLDLENSSLIFKEPTENHYHTLHIGSGKPDTEAVYNATGNAQIYFNIKWTDGTPITEQETDRLLIHGDVSGSTTVYIKSDLGDKESVINASAPSNSSGISLIQVSGKADENSFKLAHGYITRGGSPYKYTLTGYGSESSHGKANIEQSLFDEKEENFWDFRLHKEFLGPNSTVEAPVAQMASYLVMPNALFYSGLTDIAKQNALLANLRTSVVGKQQEKQNGFFLYTYGSTGTLSSENAPHQYGYSGAHLRYAALQGG